MTPDVITGFSLGRLRMGGFVPVPPYGRGQVQGDKASMGGTHEGGLMRGDIDLIEGDLTSIDYIIN